MDPAHQLIESLGGDLAQLADILAKLDQRLVERQYTTVPIDQNGVGRAVIVGGQANARVAIMNYTIIAGAAGATFQWETGSGGTWGPLCPLIVFGNNGGASPNGGSVPVLISGVSDSIAIEVTAGAVGGHATYTTIETGP